MKDEIDFRQFYYLESYLFDTVRPRFEKQGKLSAFDFFCIVVWKANRAKSRIAKNLLKRGKNLDEVVSQLTRDLAQQPTARERLRYLIGEWNFHLPVASAILTVLYPDEFTVYDARVCSVLGGFHNLANRTRFENLWAGYEAFRHAVAKLAPEELPLRDKDRYLWGKSFYEQLKEDIGRGFEKIEDPQPSKINLFDKYLQLPEEELEWEL